MNITGCGCDIVKINRFDGIIEKFKEKYFLDSEICYINSKPKEKQSETLAGLFSVKESILKALGIGGGNSLSLKCIEITHNENGQPTAKIHSELYKDKKIHISISHTSTDALSFAVVE